MLQQEKYTSALFCEIEPKTPFEMAFSISKLKHLKKVTSLNLKILPLKLCTPHFLKSLSITLSHLKSLKSLSISFPVLIEMTPKLLTSFFFALRRLNSLVSLSLKLRASRGFNDKSWIALSSCLTRLPQLKSFTVALENSERISRSVLNFFAPIFKKLTSLQNLEVNLKNCNCIYFQYIIDFFASLNNLKSLKSLALNFKGCTTNTASTDPISTGLNVLDPSILESLDLKYYSERNPVSLPELGTALQRFTSLRNLTLGFTRNQRITDQGLHQLASSLQTLHSLSSFKINLSTTRLTNSVRVLGDTIKHFTKLKSLSLNFNQTKTIDDSQLSSLSAGLQSLTTLKNLTLKFSDFIVTDRGFALFSKALQGLNELSTLKLKLFNIYALTNKTIISLSFAIGNLTKLTDLSFSLVASSDFDRKSINSLRQALENLSLLTSLYFDFSRGFFLKGEGDDLLAIFKALGRLKYLRKIIATLPFSPANITASQLYTRQVSDQTYFWESSD